MLQQPLFIGGFLLEVHGIGQTAHVVVALDDGGLAAQTGLHHAGVTDPERKRKIIGEEFIRVFEEESKKIGAVDFLAQGTIYPDVIESGLGNAAVIKSHHNAR